MERIMVLISEKSSQERSNTDKETDPSQSPGEKGMIIVRGTMYIIEVFNVIMNNDYFNKILEQIMQCTQLIIFMGMFSNYFFL